MKSTDGTKVGRTARNMYKEFKTILGNWCGKKKKSVQEIHCCHSGMYNQLHRGKQQKRGGWGWKGGNKKSSEKLKIELY